MGRVKHHRVLKSQIWGTHCIKTAVPYGKRAGNEAVLIQGHRMRFATVDLAGDHTAIRQRLLQLVNTSWSFYHRPRS